MTQAPFILDFIAFIMAHNSQLYWWAFWRDKINNLEKKYQKIFKSSKNDFKNFWKWTSRHIFWLGIFGLRAYIATPSSIKWKNPGIHLPSLVIICEICACSRSNFYMLLKFKFICWSLEFETLIPDCRLEQKG